MYENNQYPNGEPQNVNQTNYGTSPYGNIPSPNASYENAGYPNSTYGNVSYRNTSYDNPTYANYDFGSKSAEQSKTYGEPINRSSHVSQPVQASVEKTKKEPSKLAGFFKKALVCASLGLFFGLCAGIGFYAVNQTMGDGNNSQSISASTNKNADEALNMGAIGTSTAETDKVANDNKSITMVDTDITSVVKEVMPAMVSIGNEYHEEYSYFGRTFSQPAEAAGSGIVVGKNDAELLVVTNYHVIQDADRLTVTFIDNAEVDAQLKGTNASMDLAVLAVPLDKLSQETLAQVVVAKMGDSDHLNLGEPVIAIGNALGYGQSVTNGIVSALNREVELDAGMSGTFIQTNAAINPGNSGGALLNLSGEVIGINSNKIGGDVIEGMGYAIPISAAEPIISELMLKETKLKVSEDQVGYIGIQPATVTNEIAQMYGMPKGVYISQVMEGAPAQLAGLAQGDIITEIEGTTILSYEDLQEEMQYHAVGSTIEITVQRNTVSGYQEMVFEVTLGSRED